MAQEKSCPVCKGDLYKEKGAAEGVFKCSACDAVSFILIIRKGKP